MEGGVLRDLLNLLPGEHAAVLDAVRALESVVHWFKLLVRDITDRSDKAPLPMSATAIDYAGTGRVSSSSGSLVYLPCWDGGGDRGLRSTL